MGKKANLKPTQACWWIIGRDNAKQRKALAVDLHDENSELCNPNGETYCQPLTSLEYDNAESFAIIYAKEHGVPASEVYFDPDSTECFADA